MTAQPASSRSQADSNHHSKLIVYVRPVLRASGRFFSAVQAVRAGKPFLDALMRRSPSRIARGAYRMSQDRTQLVMAPARSAATASRGASPGSAPLLPRASTDHLSGAQKAAIIVRVLLAEGMQTPVSSLPPEMQAMLTQTLGSMRLVDRATMTAVVEEFVQTLEQVGVAFPDGVEGALSLLEGNLDERATRQLRAMTRGDGKDDPWTRLELAEDDDLLPLLQAEAQVVGAVMLSKLSTDKAARLLMHLPSEHAYALAIAISRTEDIAPDTVARIGATLADQVSTKPPRAFGTPPTKRMGEILNASPAGLRDALLGQLAAEDESFATGVRQAIFTFHDIPQRVEARDVPAIMRMIAPEDMTAIIAAARADDTAALGFLLDNMSKRVVETLREDAETRAKPDTRTCEAALNRVAALVRNLGDTGQITLKRTDATSASQA